MARDRNINYNSNNQDDAEAQRAPAIDVVEGVFAVVVAFIVLVLLFILMGFTVSHMCKLAFSPRSPCIYITSIDEVGPLNVSFPKAPSAKSPSSTLTGSWNVSFGYHNEEHAKITYLDGANVSIYYDGVFLGNNVIPFHTLYQSKDQEWVNMSTRIEARSVRLNDLLAYTLAQDINDKTVGYGVQVETHAFIKSKWWVGEKRTLDSYLRNTSYNTIDCPYYY